MRLQHIFCPLVHSTCFRSTLNSTSILKLLRYFFSADYGSLWLVLLLLRSSSFSEFDSSVSLSLLMRFLIIRVTVVHLSFRCINIAFVLEFQLFHHFLSTWTILCTTLVTTSVKCFCINGMVLTLSWFSFYYFLVLTFYRNSSIALLSDVQ